MYGKGVYLSSACRKDNRDRFCSLWSFHHYLWLTKWICFFVNFCSVFCVAAFVERSADDQISLSSFAYLYSELGEWLLWAGRVETKSGIFVLYYLPKFFALTIISNRLTTLLLWYFLFSVQYHQNRVDSISELERRLESSGYGVGLKMLELISYRNREVCIISDSLSFSSAFSVLRNKPRSLATTIFFKTLICYHYLFPTSTDSLNTFRILLSPPTNY